MSPEQRPYKDAIQLYLYCNKEREVPEAIIAFLESKDFEDAVRNAVSLGGDTDTLGAITGSIAEAFYGIPAVLIAECKSRIDKGLMTDVLDEFDHVLGRSMDTFSYKFKETAPETGEEKETLFCVKEKASFPISLPLPRNRKLRS